jgi:hypothetical protein
MGSSVANGAWPESIPLELSQVVKYRDAAWKEIIPATHILGKFTFADRISGRHFKVRLCWEENREMSESLRIYSLSFSLF